jgi:ubiquinone/menaquinone biosynthesis C-methylase UbiE
MVWEGTIMKECISSPHRNEEEIFHDDWADSINPSEVMVDEFFEACTSPENRIILEKLGDIRGKRILELGCGAGEASVYFAKKGAQVTATDLSSGMLRVVEQVAKLHGVKVVTKQTMSDHLDFPDANFDMVYAANLLHHVEIAPTLAEVERVLKPGGIFAAWDPLAHNPLINIYRRMATEVRTEDEHPLRMSDLRLFRQQFEDISYNTTWLFTLWIFLRFFLIERIDPNKERYWKKILLEHRRLESRYRFLERLDGMVLKMLPFLKRYCWNIVIFARKKAA